jgi:parallel beta-helix repeat protein
MPITPIVPQNGMRLTESTTFATGVYVLPDGVEIAADGVTLDGGGAILVGGLGAAAGTPQGIGIRARGRQGIAIRNVAAMQYACGARLMGCRDVTLTGNRTSRTAEIERRIHFLDIWLPAEQAYGAGIVLENVHGGLVQENDLQHQQNGLSLYSCTEITVERNDASYCSGWGFHLHGSSENVLQDNLADFCNRVYRRDEKSDPHPGLPPRSAEHVGADAAALLIIRSSCRNQVRRNSFRGGGEPTVGPRASSSPATATRASSRPAMTTSSRRTTPR